MLAVVVGMRRFLWETADLVILLDEVVEHWGYSVGLCMIKWLLSIMIMERDGWRLPSYFCLVLSVPENAKISIFLCS